MDTVRYITEYRKRSPCVCAGELLFKRALQSREFAVAKEVRDGSGRGKGTSAFEMVPSPSQSPRPQGWTAILKIESTNTLKSGIIKENRKREKG